MQQPNQSPPGCNPYAVNNKGIAHLLLILLLVAGLSVVGMFLFKMVSGGGLDVMGARIAANETSCQLGNLNVVCNLPLTRKQACAEYVPGRGTVIGSRCVRDNPLDGWGPWNYSNCSLLKPLSCPNGEARNDCVQPSTSTPGVKNTGWRCVVTDPPQGDGGWNFPGCKALVPGYLMTCSPGEEKKDDCRNERTVNGLPQVIPGYRCVPLTSPTGRCIYGNGPITCPRDYVVQSCRTTCGYGGCSGVQCAKKTPSTVVLPIIITPVPVPERAPAPAPATSCIPEWGRGAVNQQCCTGSNSSSIDSSYKNKLCYPAAAKMCHDDASCVTTSGISCCAGYTVGSCGNGAFKCTPTKSVGVTYDADGDNVPDARDTDPDGNGQQGPAQTPISIAPANGGGGGSTPPPSNNCPTCVTASGSFKTAEGKPVNGADVIVYLGNGSTAGTAKTDASGNYSLRFDKKGINFAIRSVSTSYKPAKSSYPECRGMSGVGYEDCWFKPQDMSGVDFVSTAPSVNAGRKPPTAEIASLSNINPVPQNRKINTVIRVNAYGSKVGKVELYANPAYSSAVSPKNPRCSDEAVGITPIYSTQKRWVKVGEAVYNASNAFTTGFVTITWDTGALPCTMADNRTDGVCTGSYFLGANVEDLGDMSEIGGKTPVNVLRCTSNPVGNACSPNNTYYQGLCGNSSYSRLDIVPTVSTDPVSSIVIAAKGTSVNGIGPKMDLYVKGALVKSWFVTPTLTSYKYSHDTKIKLMPSDIKIGFSNDAADAAKKEDRNLFVDYMSLYGVKYETEHPSVTSMGVWDSVTRACQRTVPTSMKNQLLACNGYFQYGTPSAALGTTVTVVATGSVYKDVGSKMDLYVNNSLVKTWYVPNKTGTYTYEAAGRVSSVKVGFSNDAYEILKDPSGKVTAIGRDLIVDYVKVGSVVYQSEGPNVSAKGVWDSRDNTCTKIVSGAGNQKLSCNGYFEYPLAR